jgi:hypothetical protein
LAILGFGLRASRLLSRQYHLSHSTSPFFLWWVFQERHSTICTCWLWATVLISASQIGTITRVSQWHPATSSVLKMFCAGDETQGLTCGRCAPAPSQATSQPLSLLIKGHMSPHSPWALEDYSQFENPRGTAQPATSWPMPNRKYTIFTLFVVALR